MPDTKQFLFAAGRFAVNTLIILSITVLLIAASELALAVINYPRYTEFDSASNSKITRITPVAGVAYKPNITNSLPGYPGTLSTDVTGFVHNGVPRSSAKELEGGIFIFGGSTVEGRGSSSNSKTIAAQLESCLQLELNINKPVVNAGFSGDYSYQQFQRAVDALGRYRPSMLIFLDGRNDAHYAQLASWRAFDSNPGIHSPFNYVDLLASRSPWERTFHDARAVSRLVNLIFNVKPKLDHRQAPNVYASLDEDKARTAADAYLGIHDAIHSIGAIYGIPVHSFLQPTPAVGPRQPTVDEALKMKEFLSREGINHGYYAGIGMFYRAVRARANPRVTDISTLFDRNASQMYVDSVHYNDESNRLIAQKICSVIRPK